MDVEDSDLEALEWHPSVFHTYFQNYAKEVFFLAKLFPVVSEQRTNDAHAAWCMDIDRVGVNERLQDGLDHFKRCGHLAYWLRRSSPVVDAEDIAGMLTYAGGSTVTPEEQGFRDLLFEYGNEYLAFDFALQFSLFYERDGASPRAHGLNITQDYIRTVCHFLKFKNVSPHALFLIYKSLLHR